MILQAIQERHENSLLKSEIEKLRNESKALRTNNEGLSCLNCGFATTSKDPTTSTNEQQQLWIENSRLKAEVRQVCEPSDFLDYIQFIYINLKCRLRDYN